METSDDRIKPGSTRRERSDDRKCVCCSQAINPVVCGHIEAQTSTVFVDERAIYCAVAMGFVEPASKKQEHTLPAD